MNKKELLELIVSRFRELPEVESLIDETIEIRAKALSPEEAIGNTARKDYPILDGKDVMIEAVCNGASGQAFTCAPADFFGTLNDILNMDFENDPQAAGLLIATINAVMASLNICDRTVHCKNEGPALCGVEMMKYFKEKYTQIKLSVPNAEAEELNTFLKEHGIKSKAGFIREAIKEKMEHYETNK